MSVAKRVAEEMDGKPRYLPLVHIQLSDYPIQHQGGIVLLTRPPWHFSYAKFRLGEKSGTQFDLKMRRPRVAPSSSI